MEINPQRVRTAEFDTVRKGLDPEQVRDFLDQVADELERAQNQSTAMEARARAAMTRLQELTEQGAGDPAATPAGAESSSALDTPAPADDGPDAASAATDDASDASDTDGAPAAARTPTEITASVDESETISRTMLLAQRAADLAVAEAHADAERLRTEAETTASEMVEQARSDARAAGETERAVVESEVNALVARRDFLESDVDHMERFLVEQRSRLRDAATAMIDIAERVPGGLGEVRRPLLSASDDTSAGSSAADPPDDTPGADTPGADTPDIDTPDVDAVAKAHDAPQDPTLPYDRPLGDELIDDADDIAGAADRDPPTT